MILLVVRANGSVQKYEDEMPSLPVTHYWLMQHIHGYLSVKVHISISYNHAMRLIAGSPHNTLVMRPKEQQ